jgi:hypothetical protein
MKIKKIKFLIVSLMILGAILSVLILPNIKFASSLGNISYFNVSLTISNSIPSVIYVAAVSDSPSEGTTKVITFNFNASDANGVSDIPAGNALVKINKSGTTYTSGACIDRGSSGTTQKYECNVTINYYDTPGIWTINASVFDGAAATADNTSQYLTLGTTYAISLKTTSLTFSGTPGQNGVSASNNPQVVNNTGNGAFSQINLTAYELKSGSNYIGASNFSVNTTNNATGQTLINNTMVLVANSSLAVNNSRNLYVYLNVPNGVANATYTSVSSWIVTMS